MQPDYDPPHHHTVNAQAENDDIEAILGDGFWNDLEDDLFFDLF